MQKQVGKHTLIMTLLLDATFGENLQKVVNFLLDPCINHVLSKSIPNQHGD